MVSTFRLAILGLTLVVAFEALQLQLLFALSLLLHPFRSRRLDVGLPVTLPLTFVLPPRDVPLAVLADFTFMTAECEFIFRI